MRVIVDTNVVLDVLLRRAPFFQPASAIFSLAETSRIEALLCATSITTVEYLVSKSFAAKETRKILHNLLSIFEIALVNRAVIERALRSRMRDFEDAVIDEAGCQAGAELLITRNPKDFRSASLKVFDPVLFLAQIKFH